MTGNKKTARRLSRGIATIVLLMLGLCVTSFALILATVRVEQNLFETGKVKLNLNDGAAVVSADHFEPGATLKRDFFLENQSTDSVYYKLYFTNVSGGLADVVEVTITEKIDTASITGLQDVPADKILYTGLVSDLTRANVSAANASLGTMEKHWFSIFFHFPESAGNSAQSMELSFDLCAEAVQTRNNAGRSFD